MEFSPQINLKSCFQQPAINLTARVQSSQSSLEKRDLTVLNHLESTNLQTRTTTERFNVHRTQMKYVPRGMSAPIFAMLMVTV
jgi:hypothetical protein